MLSEKILCRIADFLPNWGSSGSYHPGVKAVCVAGGGESLLNPATPVFIDRLTRNGIEIGVVTNGTRINTCIDALSQCTWVGVSVDAGSAKTFNKLKGLPEDSDIFSRIIDNMATLADYSRFYATRLGASHPSYGVSYKYLLYKENIGEIYEAAKIAKSIGCKSIHFRPAGTTLGCLHDCLRGSYPQRQHDVQVHLIVYNIPHNSTQKAGYYVLKLHMAVIIRNT